MSMRLNELFENLNEAPLADFGVHGDLDGPGSFRGNDYKAFTNQKWIEKVHSHFSRCPFKFNVYLINIPNTIMSNGRPLSSVGIKQTINSYVGQGDIHTYRLEKIKNDLKSLGIDFNIPVDNDAITFIMTDNEGDEAVGLTPWILVHRLVHALMNSHYGLMTGLNGIIENLLNIFTREELMGLLKFKTGRERTETRTGELVVDAITQYIVRGSFTVNPLEPEDSRTRALQKAVSDINKTCYEMLENCVGHAFGIAVR